MYFTEVLNFKYPESESDIYRKARVIKITLIKVWKDWEISAPSVWKDWEISALSINQKQILKFATIKKNARISVNNPATNSKVYYSKKSI